MIKIALLDGWPNLEENAEIEFIKRFIIAADNLGDVTAQRVVTSDDIYEFAPDAVLISHEFSRKLTEFPTIGLLWSPLSFFVSDEYRKVSVRSYDGYIVGNATLRNYAEDIQFSRALQKPVSDQFFLPTSYQTPISALDDVESPSLCYLGVHWDGNRHSNLFKILTQRNKITLYGPPAGWKAFPDHYGGMVPFDGKSVQKTIAKHGVSLCLHKKEHRQQNTPSMRIFETLSVGALPICDQIEFAHTELSDVALFIDTSRSPKHVADQVEEHLCWIQENPDQASERARRGKLWFEKHWSLEVKIRDLIIPMIQSVTESGMFKSKTSVDSSPSLVKKSEGTAFHSKPECEIIMRTGGRDIEYLQRAVDSVVAADSDDCKLGLVIVDYKSRDDIRDFVDVYVRPKIQVRYLTSDDNGFRSTALWRGMHAVESPFMAHLDDDDTVHPNHYRQLKKVLLASKDSPMAYTGVIKKEDDKDTYYEAFNFIGPKRDVIKETRDLFFLSDFDITKLSQFDNYIQSNTWMARTDLLQSLIGDDPRLEVVEDVYLYLLMAQRGPFAFTSSPTAVWHWRSSKADNSMTSVSMEKWSRDGERVARRLENLRFQYVPDLLSLKILKPVSMNSFVVGQNSNSISDLQPLLHNVPIEGGSSLTEFALFKDFHHAEASGVWSRDLVSEIIFRLDPDVSREGGELVIEYTSSDTGVSGRFIEFNLNEGSEVQRVEISGWDVKQVSLPIKPGSGEQFHLMVKIDSLYVPAGNTADDRKLGVHIRSLVLLSEENRQLTSDEKPIDAGLDEDDINSDGAPNGNSSTGGHMLVDNKDLRTIHNPILSYYRSGTYAHISVSEMRDDESFCICKLQNNAGNFSIEFDLLELEVGEHIDQRYVEMDNAPVFRIYFNGNVDDINLRFDALPSRLKKVVDEVSATEMSYVLYVGSRESISAATKLLNDIQVRIRAMGEKNKIVL